MHPLRGVQDRSREGRAAVGCEVEEQRRLDQLELHHPKLALVVADEVDPVSTLLDLKHITDQLLVRNPSYRCTRCGFGARSHHWQCPSCKEWGAVKPLLNYAVV